MTPTASDCACLFAHAGKSRILCVTRVFETGAERINARLHSRAAESAGVAAERIPFVVGEPLIVLRNDYERGLFNGDNGIMLWVRRGNGAQIPMAVFPRGDNFVAFRFDATARIRRARLRDDRAQGAGLRVRFDRDRSAGETGRDV